MEEKKMKNRFQSNVEMITEFAKPLTSNVMNEFIEFSEELIDNNILLEVRDVIALFKMLQAEKGE